jgi:hypothetical protein
MKKRFISLFIALVLLISVCGQVNAQSKFADVPENAWYRESVERLSDLNIINGREDGKFYPNDTVSIAEFIKMLTVAKGYTVRELQDGEYWAQPYIDKAYEEGYVIKNEEFYNFDLPIMRGEIARMIVRCMEEEIEITDRMAYIDTIEDFVAIYPEHQDYVLKAYISGIVCGHSDGRFGARDTATRAEAAAMILRFIDQSKRIPAKPLVKPDYFLDPEIVVEENTNLALPRYFSIKIKNYKLYSDDYQFKIDFTNYPQLNEIEQNFGGWHKIVINQWWNYTYLRGNSGSIYTLFNDNYTTRENEKTFKIEPGMKIEFTISVKRGSEIRTYNRTAIVPDVKFIRHY